MAVKKSITTPAIAPRDRPSRYVGAFGYLHGVEITEASAQDLEDVLSTRAQTLRALLKGIEAADAFREAKDSIRNLASCAMLSEQDSRAQLPADPCANVSEMAESARFILEELVDCANGAFGLLRQQAPNSTAAAEVSHG